MGSVFNTKLESVTNKQKNRKRATRRTRSKRQNCRKWSSLFASTSCSCTSTLLQHPCTSLLFCLLTLASDSAPAKDGKQNWNRSARRKSPHKLLMLLMRPHKEQSTPSCLNQKKVEHLSSFQSLEPGKMLQPAQRIIRLWKNKDFSQKQKTNWL